MSDVALQAADMSAGYSGSPAISGVNLTLKSGEIVALLGSNGAGKTTTIRALSGQIPLLSGTVEVNGEPLRGSLHRRAQRGMGIITESRCVFMELTCSENLRLGRGTLEGALEHFPELKPLLGVKVGSLSGGEQQMLALARVLTSQPTLLLVDELSLGLAPIVVQRLLLALREAADLGVAVLIVEQHARLALRTADRAYVLQRGQMVLEGPADELAARSEELADLYL